MSNLIIAIDIGTSSVKGLAVLPDGAVVGTYQKKYGQLHPKPGYAEQDPDLVANAIFDLLKEMIDKTGTQQLACVSFSSAMHSLMALDKSGTPVTPLITWADTRSFAQSAKLRSTTLGQELYEITGTPIHPMSPLCKLIWLREAEPELHQKTHKFIGIKEYVFHKLFGEFVVDYSIASATGLFDVVNSRWSSKALSVAGIREDQLSRPVPQDSIFSQMKADWAKRIGMDRAVPFVIGASDGCLSNLGSDVTKPGELAITIGTSGAVRMTSSKYVPDPLGRLFNYRLDASKYVVGGATNNGAVLLSWFDTGFEQRVDHQSFLQDASKIDPGADGLVFLPYVFGERAPIYDPNARGVFFGVSVDHTKSHFKRAILEGICFEIKTIVDAMKNMGKIKRVMASGGFSNSPMWVQLLADILDREISVAGEFDSSAMGAAKLGFEVMGIKTKGTWVDYHITYSPDSLHRSTYEQAYALFNSLYSSLSGQFAKLSEIRH